MGPNQIVTTTKKKLCKVDVNELKTWKAPVAFPQKRKDACKPHRRIHNMQLIYANIYKLTIIVQPRCRRKYFKSERKNKTRQRDERYTESPEVARRRPLFCPVHKKHSSRLHKCRTLSLSVYDEIKWVKHAVQ